MKLKGKVVVITGAGSGMGRAYALEFARLGARLALNDFDAEALDETVVLLGGKTDQAVCSDAFDVADRDAMFRFADKVRERFGTADIVINNAGVEGGGGPAWELKAEDFRRVMNINFYGVLNGTQAFLPMLLAQDSGHIVNVSSIFGLVGSPNSSDYCASKFAVRGFTEALMVELQESNVQVHLVHPGGIATNISRTEAGAQFAKKYLTTSCEDMARFLIRSLRKGSPRIVYGNNSLMTWLGSNFVPTKLLNRIIWREVREVLDPAPYRKAGVWKE